MVHNEERPPTPEEITKKISDFMQSQFPGAVNFSQVTPNATEEPPAAPVDKEPEETPEPLDGDIFDFNYRPRDIKAHLDRYVIEQNEAKKVLSIAVCDHYNHAKYLRKLAESDPEQARHIEFAKQNVIVVGPTGVGKTYLVKHIAELIGVPFVKADATKFSETGYVGADVDDLVRELVQKADGNVELAQYGIIYIDEVDKIATKGSMIGRDVSGRGVQTTLLKLMEETEVSLRNPMDFQSQMQVMFDSGKGKGANSINTRHILFIVSGAFSGLQEIVTRRLRSGTMGFGAETLDVPEDAEIFKQLTTQDFIEYGFEAEFVGRLPVRVVCEQLSADDLFSILKDSEGSVIRQYERDFEAFGIDARFDDSALHAIARQAAGEETGARGLLTVCERTLRDFKFELPGTSIEELVITGDLVENPRKHLDQIIAEAGEVVDQKVVSELVMFSRSFREKHGVEIEFENAAIQAIEELARNENASALQICNRLYRDYQFGLKLIEKNSGQSLFSLPVEAVNKPDRYLSDLVVKSYRDASDESEVDEAEVSTEGSTG